MNSTLLWIVLALVAVGVALGGLRRLAARRARRQGHGDASAMLARDLRGRAVLSISDASRVGEVDDVLLDASGRSVIGFRIRHGRIPHRDALERDQVAAVGPDAVMVRTPAAVNDITRLPALGDVLRLDKLRGTRVVTRSGEVVGRVWDIEIDGHAQHVEAYVLGGSVAQRLTHRRPVIPVSQLQQMSDGGVIVVGDTTAATT